MPTPFRPRLEALDARDLPSVTPFSLTTNDGTLVSGTFDYADAAVDPALAAQSVPISDLNVALNGQAATLPVQLDAATAVFALGQFQGLSLTAIAVAGDMVTTIATTGTMSPVSVTNPGGQLTPIPTPQPGPGPVPTNWGAMVDVYNSNVAILGAYVGKMQDLMARYDELLVFIKELRIKANLAKLAGRTDEALAFNQFADAYYQQLRGISQALWDAGSQYADLYQTVQFQGSFLVGTAPLDQRDRLRPLPAYFEIPIDPADPDNYFAPIAGIA